ncbi:hypothetical protein [uncultured Dysgonomonas sp.]|uniref:Uncharacterized protein n=1 Tax=uncultured Dysgonomonas sp. TaxID=206096 RepID=A0A212K3E7_9BACT|nr:hypothetical protein [uncultured Dysgonomonas sp.]SBW06045.1 conserved exported hypothetical protein [uncultured Dysgonomonas sp.]
MKQITIFMKKGTTLNRLLLLCLVICFCQITQAQVTIGSGEIPNADALLDLTETSTGTSSKGLLLPRVSLSSTALASPLSAHVAGMTVYNTATAGDVTPGHYYNDGNKWVKLFPEVSSVTPKFFYMPSIVLPTDTADPSYNSGTQEFTVNLHELYIEQFGLTKSTSSVKGVGATTLPVLTSDALEYFITYYDNTVFQNVTLSNVGVLKYKLFTQFTYSEKTFMNIVFKVK